jgi:hypothetical protein
MPELPEVETVRRGLVEQLAGRTFAGLSYLEWPRTIEAPAPEELHARLAGQRVLGVRRRAKFIVIDLAGGEHLVIHLRMTGRLQIAPREAPRDRHGRVALAFDDGDELRFSDTRRFGRIGLYDDDGLAGRFHGLGPEPLGDELDADAFAALLASTGRGRTTRPELVVVVSHEVAKRGWSTVEEGEVCKIPGIGPVAPQVAREIAADAFLTGVFYDGTDLRHMRRWSRSIPVEVAVALELGDPPHFDGIACVDCGNRFATELDHVEPHSAGGVASIDNLKPRCYRCHQEKTARDRAAGWFKGADPPGARTGEQEIAKGLGPSP